MLFRSGCMPADEVVNVIAASTRGTRRAAIFIKYAESVRKDIKQAEESQHEDVVRAFAKSFRCVDMSPCVADRLAHTFAEVGSELGIEGPPQDMAYAPLPVPADAQYTPANEQDIYRFMLPPKCAHVDCLSMVKGRSNSKCPKHTM